MSYIPLYTKSSHYAEEHGELEALRACRNANKSCTEKMKQALIILEESQSPDPDKEIKSLIKEFGYERVANLFACNVLGDNQNYPPMSIEWAESRVNWDNAVDPDLRITGYQQVLKALVDYLVQQERRILSDLGIK